MRHKTNIDEFVDLMFEGKIETKKDFPCPECGGSAHASAGEIIRDNNLLGISVWCDSCNLAIETYGAKKWNGWEKLT